MAKIAKVTKENRKEAFKNLYDTWAATILGLVPSDVEAFEFFVKEHGGLTANAEIVHFTGKDMNEFFALVKTLILKILTAMLSVVNILLMLTL